MTKADRKVLEGLADKCGRSAFYATEPENESQWLKREAALRRLLAEYDKKARGG